VKKEEFEQSVLELWVKSSIPMTRANLQYHSGASARQVKTLLAELMKEGVVEAGSDSSGELIWTVPGAHRPADGPRSFDELERLQRLSAEVEADLSARQAKARAAEAVAREQAERDAAARKALVVARKQELREARGGDLEELSEPEPNKRGGFLSRLFGRDKFGARDALEVASEARGELDKPRAPKEKSLLWSGGLSFFLGPVGWLYAGSWRESIPGALLYLGAAAILQKFPAFILMPIMSIALPVSGLIGVGYAWQYNKKGKRVRLLSGKDKKQLGR
jgi:hypothetical protein